MNKKINNRILFVGDVHGNADWKQPVADALSRSADVVFLGDYVDSFDVDPWMIFENLKDIIAYKKKYTDRITLLLGNHDYAYVFAKFGISGFNTTMWHDYRQVINDNWDCFDLAWGIQGRDKYTLATHAGLTQWFYETLEHVINDDKHIMKDTFEGIDWKNLPLHEMINYFKDQSNIMWIVGPERGGVNKTGGILWADKSELTKFNYPGIDQVVGHTPCRWIEQRWSKENDRLFFVDSYQNEYVSTLMLEF